MRQKKTKIIGFESARISLRILDKTSVEGTIKSKKLWEAILNLNMSVQRNKPFCVYKLNQVLEIALTRYYLLKCKSYLVYQQNIPKLY